MKKLNKIYHIADIHIRNLKRHKEYSLVFNRLYDYLKSVRDDDSIILLAGDIVHAKTDMTPEVVDMTQNFLRSLSDIMPTILIPGNHDANLNNPSRLDALSPIVQALNHPNLHYYKNTTIFEFGGVTFAHKSVFDGSDGFIPSSDVDGEFKIGLFHGPVDGIQTEHGFKIDNKKVTVESFNGYDLVLLGDIHVPNNSVGGVHTIKYPGSLISQNHSESIYPEHGMLVWDIQTKSSTFVHIENAYGYGTIDIDGGKITTNGYIPPKPRLRLRVKDTTTTQLNKIITQLKKKYEVEELSIQKVLSTNDVGKREQITLYNVRDVGFQNKLLEDYLISKFGIDTETLEVVKGINADINSKIVNPYSIRSSVWIPKVFEFSNMFSYGEDNYINFQNMKGAYGVFAPNASGKSSLWDALSFCIFDKCSRTSKAVDVMNYSKNNFYCKFIFELNGRDYVIERKANKSTKKGTVKVDTQFYTYNDAGDIESLNGDERRDTNSLIRQYVGTYDDFILTALSTQFNNSGFIDKSQKERKELLAQFLDMDVFEQLYSVASEEIKELSTLLKDYKGQDFPTKLSSAELNVQAMTGSIYKLESEKVELESQLNILNQNIENKSTKLVVVDGTLNLESLNNELIECKNDSKVVSYTIRDMEADLVPLQEKLSRISDFYTQYNLEELKQKDNEWRILERDISLIRGTVSKYEIDLSHSKKHLEGIGSFTYDDNCEHCVNNKNTPFAQQSLELEKKINSLNTKIDELKIQLSEKIEAQRGCDVKSDLEKVNQIKEKEQQTNSKYYLLLSQLNDYKSDYTKIETRYEKLVDDIERAKKQEKSVEFNRILTEEINDLKQKRKGVQSELADATNNLIDLLGGLRVQQNIIETVNQSIEKLNLMEIKYAGYEYYLSAVKRDGIPYGLISEILPKLEVEINNILQPIVDFQIILDTDGKNINSYICYGDDKYWPLELTSGMEKFVSSIAIRTALINVSNLPHPNFIAIDEGFGSLDTDNFNSLYLLFDYLKTQFDFIITISHIDKTRDMVDHIIDINKVNSFSSIKYL
jgi:DNA repair exonuclease SbcCD ATPase subunit/DNA repair exonuclease SbcCD nuclease subunit